CVTGWARNPSAFITLAWGSNTLGNGRRYRAMNALAGPSWSWLSTPTNWTFPAKRRATDAIVGASAIQGPHHDAQTLTTTTRPRSWRSKSENDVRSNVG